MSDKKISEKRRAAIVEQMGKWLRSKKRGSNPITRKGLFEKFTPAELVHLMRTYGENPRELDALLNYVKTHPAASQELEEEDLVKIRDGLVVEEVMTS